MSAAVLFWALPAIPLGILGINLLTWRRPRPREERELALRPEPFVSVLIPARNEAERIEDAVRSALDSHPEVLEVLVCDDQSTDETASIVRRLSEGDDRVRLVSGDPLPPGWVGKPHACAQLAARARGEVLLFLDADVVLEARAVGALCTLLEGPSGARVITAVPRQITGGFFERLILPLLLLTYCSWLPLRLVELGRSPKTVAANGQILMIRRADEAALSGFSTVRAELVDDMAFCRHAKRSGYRVCFVDGTELARCRMYRSAQEVWHGFSKNLFEGLGSSVLTLSFTLSLYLGCWVLPYWGLLGAILGQSTWWGPGLLGVALCVLSRFMLAVRYRQPFEGILLHPFSVLALTAIALNSARWSLRGRIRWADRVYGGRETRARESAGLVEGVR